MRPDQPLFIYELRVLNQKTFDFDTSDPGQIFGPDLAGFHREADFAFLFFTRNIDLDPFLATYPQFELRQIHHLRYDQWQDGAAAVPINLGQINLMPWTEDAIPPESENTIFIDPGLAFGFGGHPTTRACLHFLLRLYRPGTLHLSPPQTALDLGTGTGVLAIAAAKLGATEILGVDHSHLAIDCARHNLALNHLDSLKMELGLAQDHALSPGELLMANIPLFVLEDLLELGAFKDRHWLIISGLLPSEGQKFQKKVMDHHPFKIVDQIRDDRWISWLMSLNKDTK